ncbi:MAG: mechanosensitive ion channel family protein [Gammaproteobacteria bacterium]|nr:mechanosensitive ion channel family protein [Gammaproteobacteria bacterium]
MNDYFAQILQFKSEWLWVLSVFLVVLATVVANFIARRLLARLAHKLGQNDSQWDDVLLDAASRPLAWLIWIVGIIFAADIIYAETNTSIFLANDTIRDIGTLVCITWFLLRFIKGAESVALSRKAESGIDQHTAEAIGKLVRLAIIITAVLVTMQTLGYSISGILAFGGVGGIAVGFAAKDLLANFFGGLMIYLDRPFQVGDWIRSPDKELEGTVENIGWRMTQIRTFDKRPIYVPNSVFSNIIVENPSRMSNRRIYETIGIRYDDIQQMDAIVEAVKDMLTNHPEIDTGQTMIVNFNAFADSSVDFFIYTFTKTTDWVKFHQIKQDVLLKVAHIIEQNKAEIAFPTTTVMLPEAATSK